MSTSEESSTPSPSTHPQAAESADHTDAPSGSVPGVGELARLCVGGAMMGVANLVPGISGGTMLVAAGVYQGFIDAIADATRFRLSARVIVTLGVVVAAAGVAIVSLASLVSLGLESFRWGMYSLFIGLTLGGVPVLWKMTKPMTGAAWAGAGAGIAIMLGIVALQSGGAGGGSGEAGMLLLGLGGVAGASAMILPGVSGAYLLLLLGIYDTVIGSIKDTVKSAASGDLSGALGEMGVLVPVGVGVLVGIVGVSNVLKVVLHRYEKATLGVLLGLLIAAPAGLYPFREGVPPEIGDELGGEVVTEENLNEFDPKDWAERTFVPGFGQIAGALALVGVGIGCTGLVARMGRDQNR